MTRRITEKPIRIGFELTESAANTFTTTAINLPTVGGISIARSGATKSIAIEVMKIASELTEPSIEAGQNNTVSVQLVKGAAPTVQLRKNNQLSIWRRVREFKDQTVTSVGEIFSGSSPDRMDDLTDGDGNGEIVADNEIHVSILGVGNSSAMNVRGYLLCHLIELDQSEAVIELIEQSQ